MRKYLLTAVAAAAIATPALAQSTGPDVGIEGGIMFPRDTDVDADVTYNDPVLGNVTFDNAVDLDYKKGYDIDAIAGYDLGMFRIEGELGYKRAKLDELQYDQDFIDAYQDSTGVDLTGVDFDLDDHVSVLSGMVNGLADFDAGGFRVYGGGGVGRARVKLMGDSDSAWAYQLIAGVGVPISGNLEAGLKYRYFRTGGLNFEGNRTLTDADVLFNNDSHYSSHSVLASLIYNFGSPAPALAPIPAAVPAPPPAPVAPATQTCPDGSVILATDYCPAPPPPPPPPAPPAGERG
jgi:opacity protein-like surface antigen